MTLVVGLTGGIASGKSTVSNMLKNWGIEVIDADIEARLAVEVGQPAYEKIISAFGTSILQEDETIDRTKLGSIIFHQPKMRQVLNEIVHPEVRRQMNMKKEEVIARGDALVILDIPLLFESNLTEMVDTTMLVYVDEHTQIERLMKRNQLTKDEALARIQSQMPISEKRERADYIVDNSGPLTSTREQVQKWLEKRGIITS